YQRPENVSPGFQLARGAWQGWSWLYAPGFGFDPARHPMIRGNLFQDRVRLEAYFSNIAATLGKGTITRLLMQDWRQAVNGKQRLTLILIEPGQAAQQTE